MAPPRKPLTPFQRQGLKDRVTGTNPFRQENNVRGGDAEFIQNQQDFVQAKRDYAAAEEEARIYDEYKAEEQRRKTDADFVRTQAKIDADRLKDEERQIDRSLAVDPAGKPFVKITGRVDDQGRPIYNRRKTKETRIEGGVKQTKYLNQRNEPEWVDDDPFARQKRAQKVADAAVRAEAAQKDLKLTESEMEMATLERQRKDMEDKLKEEPPPLKPGATKEEAQRAQAQWQARQSTIKQDIEALDADIETRIENVNRQKLELQRMRVQDAQNDLRAAEGRHDKMVYSREAITQKEDSLKKRQTRLQQDVEKYRKAEASNMAAEDPMAAASLKSWRKQLQGEVEAFKADLQAHIKEKEGYNKQAQAQAAKTTDFQERVARDAEVSSMEEFAASESKQVSPRSKAREVLSQETSGQPQPMAELYGGMLHVNGIPLAPVQGPEGSQYAILPEGADLSGVDPSQLPVDVYVPRSAEKQILINRIQEIEFELSKAEDGAGGVFKKFVRSGNREDELEDLSIELREAREELKRLDTPVFPLSSDEVNSLYEKVENIQAVSPYRIAGATSYAEDAAELLKNITNLAKEGRLSFQDEAALTQLLTGDTKAVAEDFDYDILSDKDLDAVLKTNNQKNFVKRILDPDRKELDLGDGQTGTHLMENAEVDGRFISYPTIVEKNGKLVQLSSEEAIKHAKRTGEFIEFDDPKDAEYFSKNYKRAWDEKFLKEDDEERLDAINDAKDLHFSENKDRAGFNRYKDYADRLKYVPDKEPGFWGKGANVAGSSMGFLVQWTKTAGRYKIDEATLPLLEIIDRMGGDTEKFRGILDEIKDSDYVPVLSDDEIKLISDGTQKWFKDFERNRKLKWQGFKELNSQFDGLLNSILDEDISPESLKEQAKAIQAQAVKDLGIPEEDAWKYDILGTDPETGQPNQAAIYLAAFYATNNPAYYDAFKEYMTEDDAGRAFHQTMQDYTERWGDNEFLVGLRSGMVANLQESTFEAAEWVVTAGVAKFLTKGAKVARMASKVRGAYRAGAIAQAGERFAVFADDLAKGVTKASNVEKMPGFQRFGVFQRKAGAELGWGKSTWNSIVQPAKAGIIGASTTEWWQEWAASLGELGSTPEDRMAATINGAMYGPFGALGPVTATTVVQKGMEWKAQAEWKKASEAAKKKYIATWNEENPQAPITEKTYDAAAAIYGNNKFIELRNRGRAAAQNLMNPGVWQDPRAMQYWMDQVGALSVIAESEQARAVNAIQEIEGIEDGQQAQAVSALLKMANGTPLTVAEETALQELPAPNGQPLVYFKGDNPNAPIVTDAALEWLEGKAPAVRSYLQKSETEQLTMVEANVPMVEPPPLPNMEENAPQVAENDVQAPENADNAPDVADNATTESKTDSTAQTPDQQTQQTSPDAGTTQQKPANQESDSESAPAPETNESGQITPTRENTRTPGKRVTLKDGRKGEVVSETDTSVTVEMEDGTTEQVALKDIAKRSTTTTIKIRNSVEVGTVGSGGATVTYYDNDGNSTVLYQSAGENEVGINRAWKDALDAAKKFAEENNLSGYEVSKADNTTTFVPVEPSTQETKPSEKESSARSEQPDNKSDQPAAESQQTDEVTAPERGKTDESGAGQDQTEVAGKKSPKRFRAKIRNATTGIVMEREIPGDSLEQVQKGLEQKVRKEDILEIEEITEGATGEEQSDKPNEHAARTLKLWEPFKGVFGSAIVVNVSTWGAPAQADIEGKKLWLANDQLKTALDGMSAKERDAYYEQLVTHELIHFVVANKISPEKLASLWNALPKEIQQKVVESYYTQRVYKEEEKNTENPAEVVLEAINSDTTGEQQILASHEFLRMYLEANMQSSTTEAVMMRREVEVWASWNQEFADKLKAILADIVNFMVNEVPKLLSKKEAKVAQELLDDIVASLQADMNKIEAMRSGKVNMEGIIVNIPKIPFDKRKTETFFDSEGADEMVDLSDLVVVKDQVEDEKFKAGKKKYPVQTALDRMAEAAEGKGSKRGPISVVKLYGRIFVVDGTATVMASSALLLDQVPVKYLDLETGVKELAKLFQKTPAFNAHVERMDKYAEDNQDLWRPFYSKYEEALPEFVKMMKELGESLGLEVVGSSETAYKSGQIFVRPSLKKPRRLMEKFLQDKVEKPYLTLPESIADMKDIFASTVVLENGKDFTSLLAKISELTGTPIDQFNIKDKREEPMPGGYRDIKIRVPFGNGLWMEVLVNTPEMIAEKQGLGHLMYEVTRSMEAIGMEGYANMGMRTLNARLRGVSTERYDAAWAARSATYFRRINIDSSQTEASVLSQTSEKDKGAKSSDPDSSTQNNELDSGPESRTPARSSESQKTESEGKSDESGKGGKPLNPDASNSLNVTEGDIRSDTEKVKESKSIEDEIDDLGATFAGLVKAKGMPTSQNLRKAEAKVDPDTQEAEFFVAAKKLALKLEEGGYTEPADFARRLIQILEKAGKADKATALLIGQVYGYTNIGNQAILEGKPIAWKSVVSSLTEQPPEEKPGTYREAIGYRIEKPSGSMVWHTVYDKDGKMIGQGNNRIEAERLAELKARSEYRKQNSKVKDLTQSEQKQLKALIKQQKRLNESTDFAYDMAANDKGRKINELALQNAEIQEKQDAIFMGELPIVPHLTESESKNEEPFNPGALKKGDKFVYLRDENGEKKERLGTVTGVLETTTIYMREGMSGKSKTYIIDEDVAAVDQKYVKRMATPEDIAKLASTDLTEAEPERITTDKDTDNGSSESNQETTDTSGTEGDQADNLEEQPKSSVQQPDTAPERTGTGEAESDRSGTRTGSDGADNSEFADQSEGGTSVERPDQIGTEEVSEEGGADRTRPTGDRELSGSGASRLNHVIPPGTEEIAPRGNGAKFKANIAAIKLLKQLEEDGRLATPEEKAVLAQYSGWGWGKEVFSPTNPRYQKEYKQLRDLLTEEEFNAASASTKNAHYTAAPIISAMWDMAKKLGFEGGRVLEPAAGIGHFLGLMPEEMREASQSVGIELDKLTGRILKALYPETDTRIQGFEDAKLANNSFDLAISNVPFGDYKIAGRDYNDMLIHDYFFMRSIDKVKPGGLIMFITSNGTMDKLNTSVRERIADKADLVGAVRLPRSAFKSNANTDVVTDIIILRKKDAIPYKGGQDWTHSTPLSEFPELHINEYFQKNPDRVLGKNANSGTMYRENSYTVEPDGRNLSEALQQIVQELDSVQTTRTSLEDLTDIKEAREGERDNSYVERDGKVYQVIDGELKPADLRTYKEIEPEPNKKTGMAAPPVKLTPEETAYREKIALSYIRIKRDLDALVKIMNDPNAADSEIQKVQDKLNATYDLYLENTRKPTPKGNMGTKKRLNYKVMSYSPIYFLEDDPDFSRVLAIETEEKYKTSAGKTRYRFVKGAMLTGRPIKPAKPPESAKNLVEAGLVSMAYTNSIDIPMVAQLLGISEDEATQKLTESNDFYSNPETGLFEHKDKYLSGNVRTKLKKAREAAEAEPDKYVTNVEALLKVVPEDVLIEDIRANMGARWIPSSVYEAFVKHLVGREAAVKYHKALNRFTITGDQIKNLMDDNWSMRGVIKEDPDNPNEQGREVAMSFDKLFTHAINGTKPRLTVAEYDPATGRDRRVTDREGTDMAQAKVDAIRDNFDTWYKDTSVKVNFQDKEVSVQRAIEDSFNYRNNNVVAPEYDGRHLVLPGLSTEVYRTPHRLSIVARVLQEGGGMMAHGVGSGKTFSQIIIANEMKRLGMATKPMIVVQNATLGQFAASYMQAYPNANILVADDKSFQAKNRKRFMAKAASGEWDAIIVTQPQFDLLSSTPEAIEEYYIAKIGELRTALQEATDDDGTPEYTVRQIENRIAKLEERMRKSIQAAEARQDQGVHFENMGVDFLLVDEAHEYKRAMIVTNRQSVKGIPTGESAKALNMELKINGIHKKFNGKHVVLATGTPVTNTMAEAYIMLKFAAPNVLADYGINNFDDFAETFGRMREDIEFTWAGTFRMVSRFNQFVNGRQLVTMIRSGFDVKMGNKELGLKVPEVKGGGAQLVKVPQTASTQAVSEWIMDIGEHWEGLEGRDRKDNSHIPITTMQAGMAGALDPRLVDEQAEDDPNSKVNKAVENVLKIYEKTTGVYDTYTNEDGEKIEVSNGTQVIFADRFKKMNTDRLQAFANGAASEVDIDEIDLDREAAGEDNASDGQSELSRLEDQEFRAGGFNLYKDIKAKLVANGIPENEIAIIHENNTYAKRVKLWQALNDGEVRIIIGSTEKLGIGVNMQERMYAAHHLDPPRRMTPAMMEQRNGRIIRQGNLNREVEILNYGLEYSMDTGIYQMLESKGRFIAQILSGIVPEAEFEDPAEEAVMGFAQMKAELTGDDRPVKLVKIRAEISELTKERSAHNSTRAGAKRDIENAEWDIGQRKSTVEFNERELNALNKLDDPDEWKLTLKGAQTTEVVEGKKDVDERIKTLGNRLVETAQKTGRDQFVTIDVNGFKGKVRAYHDFFVNDKGERESRYVYEVSLKLTEDTVSDMSGGTLAKAIAYRRASREKFIKETDGFIEEQEAIIERKKKLLDVKFEKQAELDALIEQKDKLEEELTSGNRRRTAEEGGQGPKAPAPAPRLEDASLQAIMYGIVTDDGVQGRQATAKAPHHDKAYSRRVLDPLPFSRRWRYDKRDGTLYFYENPSEVDSENVSEWLEKRNQKVQSTKNIDNGQVWNDEYFMRSHGLNAKGMPEMADPENIKTAIANQKKRGLSPKKLMEDNKGLAAFHARRFSNIPATEFDDILAEARKGLIKAARSYDPEKIPDFSPYASLVIANTLKTAFRAGVRQMGRQLVTDSIQENMGDSSYEGGDGVTLEDRIANLKDDVVTDVSLRERDDVLSKAISTLKDRPRRIVMGLLNNETYEEIGAALDPAVSKQRVEQMVKETNVLLKKRLNRMGVKGVSPEGLLLGAKAMPAIPNERDAEYTDAVKRGDIKAAQKIVDKLFPLDPRVKMSQGLAQEMDAQVESSNDSEETITRNSVLKSLIQDADDSDAAAYDYRKELQEIGLSLGLYKGYTKEQLKDIQVMGSSSEKVKGKNRKYDFKRGDLHYRFEGWGPLDYEEKGTYDRDGNVIPLSQKIERSRPKEIKITLGAKAMPEAKRHAELEKKHNAGTITEAERKEAEGIVEKVARAAGGIKLYHGSNTFKKIEVFEGDKNGLIFLAEDPEYSKQYDMFGSGIYPLYLFPDKVLDLTELGDNNLTPEELVEGIEDQDFSINLEVFESENNPEEGIHWSRPVWGHLQKSKGTLDSIYEDSGYDAIKWKEGIFDRDAEGGERSSTAYAVRDNKKIKSAEPFTGVPLEQRFNPQSPSILNAKGMPRYNHDLMVQAKWLDREAQKLGKRDATELLIDNPDKFEELSAKWRQKHPALLGAKQMPKGPDTGNPETDAAIKALLDDLLYDLQDVAPYLEKAQSEPIGRKETGEPRLAAPVEDDDVRDMLHAVDAWREPIRARENEQEWIKAAEQDIAEDYENTRERVRSAGMSGGMLSPEDTKAAQIIMAREAGAALMTKDPTELLEAQQIVHAYRETGSEVGRAMRARVDPHKNRVERAREFLLKGILTPSPKVRRDMSNARSNEELRRIMMRDQKRIRKIEKALKVHGITFDDLFNSNIEVRLAGHNWIQEHRDQLSKKKQALAEAVKNGGSLIAAARRHKMDPKQAEVWYAEWREDLKNQLRDRVRRGVKVETLAANMDSTKLGMPAPVQAPLSDAEVEAELERILNEMGVPPLERAKTGVILSDPAQTVKVIRIAQAEGGANAYDALYEFWINNILSGPQTHVVNITGNLGNLVLDFTLQRGMEALINLAIQDKSSAQLGEFEYIIKNILPGITRGWAAAARAFDAEADFFEAEVLSSGTAEIGDFDKAGGIPPAIKGTKGRVIRTPGRALMFMDSFFKYTIGHMEAGAQAYRIAKAEGLSGNALDARIKELMEYGSLAWVMSVDKALNLTFQTETDMTKALSTALKGKHPVGKILQWFFPFIRTPYNIFRTGLRKTPLGSVSMGIRIANGLYRMKDGKPYLESYQTALFVKHLAEQVIAWGTMALLWGLYDAFEGDDDDDDKKLLIVGTRPYGEESKGIREMIKRQYGDEQIIRFGGRDGFVLSYRRYEPFATAIAAVADGIRLIKSADKYEEKADLAGKMFGYFLSQARDKTFLQGFDSIMEVVDNKGMDAKDIKGALFTAIVPNLIRQPVRNWDDYKREYRTRDPLYDALPMEGNGGREKGQSLRWLRQESLSEVGSTPIPVTERGTQDAQCPRSELD
jgi:N12 class adenine-specific DNA methylase/DNA-directed RNA polymerase specialized sigma subunit